MYNTWAHVKATFYDVIGDPSYRVIPAATAVRWANLALYDICEAARYIDTQAVQNIVSGTASYAVSDLGYDIFRVEYDGEALEPITSNALRTGMKNYSYRTGLPRYYYLDESTYPSHASPDKLYVKIWEKPSSNLTNGLRVWYHSFPTDVSDSSPSNEVEIPEWAVGAVVFYMLARAYESEYSIGMKDFDKAAMYSIMYEDIKERLMVRSRSRQRKHWVAGQPSRPSLNVLNRLPDRVPAP